MHQRRVALIACTMLAFAIMLAGCAAPRASSKPPAVEVAPTFAAGSTMSKLHQAGSLRVGVRLDQPNLSYQSSPTSSPTGFDVEVAKIVAAALGLKLAQITWVKVTPTTQDLYLQNHTVDLVIAAYSMTAQRASVVGQAGPYYITGQQFMVRANSDVNFPADLSGKKVCSVTGGSNISPDRDTIWNITEVKADSAAECIAMLETKSVDALISDGAILQGFMINDPDKLRTIGQPFTTERYAIGYERGDSPMCTFLTNTLIAAYKNGTWTSAFETTLGKTGIEAPAPPQPAVCP